MTVVRYTTANSVYEVDYGAKRVRRIVGMNEPTPRQGDDGAWKEFVSCQDSGNGLLIRWLGVNTSGSYPGTWTSKVVQTEEIEDAGADA